MMDKDLVLEYHNGQHILKLGLFFIMSCFSFCALIKILGDWRYWFLMFLVFVPALLLEEFFYRIHYTEITKDKFKTGKLKLGRMSIFEMRKKECGILFEGILDGKVFIMKFYSMEGNLEGIMNNLARYKYIEIEYYPYTKCIKSFRALYGDGNE